MRRTARNTHRTAPIRRTVTGLLMVALTAGALSAIAAPAGAIDGPCNPNAYGAPIFNGSQLAGAPPAFPRDPATGKLTEPAKYLATYVVTYGLGVLVPMTQPTVMACYHYTNNDLGRPTLVGARLDRPTVVPNTEPASCASNVPGIGAHGWLETTSSGPRRVASSWHCQVTLGISDWSFTLVDYTYKSVFKLGKDRNFRDLVVKRAPVDELKMCPGPLLDAALWAIGHGELAGKCRYQYYRQH